MEKIDFSISLTKEQKAVKDEIYQEIINHKYVKSFIQKNHVDNKYIYEHCGKIKDWVAVRDSCNRCVGLEFCSMSIKGHYLNLCIKDGFLINEMVKCHYLLDRDKRLLHLKNYLINDLKEEFLLVDLDELDTTHESAEYIKTMKFVFEFLSNPNKGLYLYGQPGVGKTYLMAGIANDLAKHNRKIAFVNVPKYISELKMLFKDAEAFDRKVKSLKSIDILVLDDIGGESVTAWSRDEILLPLLDERMEKGKITLFTSNYSMKELEERLTITNNTLQEPMAAKRLLDRIKALSCELFVKGSSRRS